MPTHRTRAVEVDAFRWDGGLDRSKDPEWLKACIYYPSSGGTYLSINNTDGSYLDAMSGDWIIRFPDGRVEKRAPEEFAAQFEALGLTCGRCDEWDSERFEDGAGRCGRDGACTGPGLSCRYPRGCGSCGNDVTQDPDGLKRDGPNPCEDCHDGSAWTPRVVDGTGREERLV